MLRSFCHKGRVACFSICFLERDQELTSVCTILTSEKAAFLIMCKVGSSSLNDYLAAPYFPRERDPEEKFNKQKQERTATTLFPEIEKKKKIIKKKKGNGKGARMVFCVFFFFF
eukprot:TRINITY_DN639_c0_g1_i4.p3 TRINITY_DN639_c0_g1~~TRINITY_DN639_c0_g1_i4.p3  ORF type:complete len:114 (+),score=10.06 TRINITY_DN639_c0_g1_i4:343-684(+)